MDTARGTGCCPCTDNPARHTGHRARTRSRTHGPRSPKPEADQSPYLTSLFFKALNGIALRESRKDAFGGFDRFHCDVRRTRSAQRTTTHERYIAFQVPSLAGLSRIFVSRSLEGVSHALPQPVPRSVDVINQHSI